MVWCGLVAGEVAEIRLSPGEAGGGVDPFFVLHVSGSLLRLAAFSSYLNTRLSTYTCVMSQRVTYFELLCTSPYNGT